MRWRKATTPLLGLGAALQISFCALICLLALLPFGGSAASPIQPDGALSPQSGHVDNPNSNGRRKGEEDSAATGSSIIPFDEIVAPLEQEAARRRLERARLSPGYAQRVEGPLNDGRINFLFFGYGETYEPPEAPNFKGSINIFSLDLRSLTISTITLNHDIRAPEVERYLKASGGITGPTKIHMAYPQGGFDLMGRTVEDATGLAVDFQLAMEDGLIKRAVDELFGGLLIDVPFELDARPIYFDGVEYPAFQYHTGTQILDGLHALQFIKAVMQGDYDASKELTVRKQIVISAVMKSARQESFNPAFWARLLAFMSREFERRSVVYDFDAGTLLFGVIQKMIPLPGRGEMLWPAMGQSVYVVDYLSGDGGVEWVTGSLNPIMQNDLANGVYTVKSFSVPKGQADPYSADLVGNYWTSVRELIRQRLGPSTNATSRGY